MPDLKFETPNWGFLEQLILAQEICRTLITNTPTFVDSLNLYKLKKLQTDLAQLEILKLSAEFDPYHLPQDEKQFETYLLKATCFMKELDNIITKETLNATLELKQFDEGFVEWVQQVLKTKQDACYEKFLNSLDTRAFYIDLTNNKSHQTTRFFNQCRQLKLLAKEISKRDTLFDLYECLHAVKKLIDTGALKVKKESADKLKVMIATLEHHPALATGYLPPSHAAVGILLTLRR